MKAARAAGQRLSIAVVGAKSNVDDRVVLYRPIIHDRTSASRRNFRPRRKGHGTAGEPAPTALAFVLNARLGPPRASSIEPGMQLHQGCPNIRVGIAADIAAAGPDV